MKQLEQTRAEKEQMRQLIHLFEEQFSSRMDLMEDKILGWNRAVLIQQSATLPHQIYPKTTQSSKNTEQACLNVQNHFPTGHGASQVTPKSTPGSTKATSEEATPQQVSNQHPSNNLTQIDSTQSGNTDPNSDILHKQNVRTSHTDTEPFPNTAPKPISFSDTRLKQANSRSPDVSLMFCYLSIFSATIFLLFQKY